MRWLNFLLFVLLAFTTARAQHLYYRQVDSAVVVKFNDSLQRVRFVVPAASSLAEHQFAYLLRFFPTLQVKHIEVVFKPAPAVARSRPRLSDILKAPSQRVYQICFSTETASTLDSVLLTRLSFNAQLGLIARELCQVEELSTSGFLDHVGWYVRQLTRRGRNKIFRDAETRVLEIGLGYQLLALNTEVADKARIDRWQSVKGYGNYVKYTKTPAMKPYLITELLSDLPVYVKQNYR